MAAARLLRNAILTGELKPGQSLGEEHIGRQLGISRTPIREALLLLQHDGLVDLPPNRPAAVRSFTATDLYEMYSLRALLEGFAARLAIPHLDDKTLEALQRSCDRYAILRDSDDVLTELADENATFHELIIQTAASALLSSMIQQARALPVIYQSYLSYSHTNRTRAWRDHVEILDALRANDAEVAELRMKQHVLWARDVAMEHLPSLDLNQ